MQSFNIEYLKDLARKTIEQQPEVNVTAVSSAVSSSSQTDFNPEHIKMVVFDVYGTILHSRLGEISILEQNSQATLYIPELKAKLDIEETQTLIHSLIADEHEKLKSQHTIDYPEVDIVDIWQRFTKISHIFDTAISKEEAMICALRYELCTNPVYQMPEAISCLKTLQNEGYSLGIISNAQFYTPLLLECLYPEWTTLEFETAIWSYQHKRGKPSVALYEQFLAESSYNADSILYIGNDKKKDYVPAKNVGMHPLLFCGDEISYRPYSPELNTIPHTCISSLATIPILIID